MPFFPKLKKLFRRQSQDAEYPLNREGLVELDAYGSAGEGDRKVIEQLLSHGADLAKPRHVVHYLYFTEPDDRERAFVELEAHGYEVHPGAIFSEIERHYSLLAERVGLVNEDKIEEERAFLAAVASRLRGAYDGWEAALD